MKHFLLGVIAASTLMSSAAVAQSNDNRNNRPDRGEAAQSRSNTQNERSWKRGERLSRDDYRDTRHVHLGWRDSGLKPPPRGQQWMVMGNQFVLVSMRNGLIVDVASVPRRGEGPGYGHGGDRNEQWRARYKRSYSYNDDVAYTECRSNADPAGVLAGALIGGLLGNAAAGRGDRGGATAAGVIAGGAIGAALTAKLDCGDRSYAYKSYADSFNGGRPGAVYRWENAQNKHRGEMKVIDYYNDEDRFRCAVFTQTVYVGNRREEARGRACQQPDGNWVIID